MEACVDKEMRSACEKHTKMSRNLEKMNRKSKVKDKRTLQRLVSNECCVSEKLFRMYNVSFLDFKSHSLKEVKDSCSLMFHMKYRSTRVMTPHLRVQDCYFRILTLLIYQSFPLETEEPCFRALRKCLLSTPLFNNLIPDLICPLSGFRGQCFIWTGTV